MDDDFMTACLEDNIEGVELILRIILGRKDITIKSVRTQKPLKNLQGRAQREQGITAVFWTRTY